MLCAPSFGVRNRHGLRWLRSQPRFWFIYKSGVLRWLRPHSLFKGLLIINFIRRAAAAFVRHGAGFVKRQTSALYPPLCLRPRSSAPKEPGSARLALYAKQQDKALY